MQTDSVLLIGFGGPTAPDQIRPFLRNVVRGRNVPDVRLEEVAHHYEAIGGCSPYNALTFGQADALRAQLGRDGLHLPVYVGMRNSEPYLADTIRRMKEEGRQRAAGVVLAPHRSQTSWERYQLDVQRAREASGGGPEVEYLPPWHTHPLFVAAMAARVEEATGYSSVAWPGDAHLVFTAHSIPVKMAESSHYREVIAASAAAIAGHLGAEQWEVVYQSASGDGLVPWLSPDVNEVIRRRDRGAVVILCPVGFLCDHVEVVYDLDVEARATAEQAGVRLTRCRTVGSHPLFIRMLAGLIRPQAV